MFSSFSHIEPLICKIVANKRTFNYNGERLISLQKKEKTMKYRNYLKQLEYGRSMVEMLGVLAVIGVLSFGGIQGYKYAMDKHRANDIIHEVNMRSRDTWNMYQTKPLPDTDEIEGWSNMTQTGFEIYVRPYTGSSMFDVEVYDVPSAVCKKTLDMEITGPIFIWTTNDAGASKRIYTGNNPEICGESDESTTMVFTSSLERFGTDEGLRGDIMDDRDEPLRHCFSDDDCYACESCFTEYPYTCRSVCDDATPVCLANGTCVQCTKDIDCSENEICNLETNTCEAPLKTCPNGTFRAANGACIKCNYAASVIIEPDVVYDEDIATQAELCQKSSCGRTVEETDAGVVCTNICIQGKSFQKLSASSGNGGQCVPCSDKRTHQINNDPESIALCHACPDHYVFRGAGWPGNFFCSVPCDNEAWGLGEYYLYTHSTGHSTNDVGCVSCNTANKQIAGGYMSWYTDSKRPQLTDKTPVDWCNACPNLHQIGDYCRPSCTQPENQEKCETPDETCKRQFQTSDGKCYACTSISKGLYVGSSDTEYVGAKEIRQSCLDCGRTIYNGYCILESNCKIGEFLGYNGSCYPCDTNGRVAVTDDETSGCSANCKMKDSSYSEDSDATPTRWVTLGEKNAYNNPTRYFCMKICPDGYFQNEDGNCYKCNSNDGQFVSAFYTFKDLQANCTKDCPEERELVRGNANCAIKECSGTRMWRNRQGHCMACDTNTIDYVLPDNVDQDVMSRYIAACENCGNRVFVPEDRCVPAVPGTTGICNNITVPNISKITSQETLNQVKLWTSDNPPEKKFRDSEGRCRSCDNPSSYGSTLAQCKACTNRRYENGQCMYGLCTAKTAFLNMNYGCVSCTTTAVKTEIDITTESRYLCGMCDSKRVMETGDVAGNNLKTYCVKQCSIGEYQRIDGKCYTGKNTGEIGTDDESIRVCRDAGRIAFSLEDADGKIHWYCSYEPASGTNFIGVDGKTVACTTTKDTLIPNTNESWKLCQNCQGTAHTVTQREDGVYCILK